MARLPALPAQSTPSKIDKEWALPAGSYGFAGLLSYLYMDVELSDPRVVGAQELVDRKLHLEAKPWAWPKRTVSLLPLHGQGMVCL